MSQTFIPYEIYLPLQYNDGTWIEEEKYNHLFINDCFRTYAVPLQKSCSVSDCVCVGLWRMTIALYSWDR